MLSLRRSKSYENLLILPDKVVPTARSSERKSECIDLHGDFTVSIKNERKVRFLPSTKKRYYVRVSKCQSSLMLYQNEKCFSPEFTLALCQAKLELLRTEFVTKHCFCVTTKVFLKRSSIHFKTTTFILYTESQVQHDQWIQALGLVIDTATKDASLEEFLSTTYIRSSSSSSAPSEDSEEEIDSIMDWSELEFALSTEDWKGGLKRSSSDGHLDQTMSNKSSSNPEPPVRERGKTVEGLSFITEQGIKRSLLKRAVQSINTGTKKMRKKTCSEVHRSIFPIRHLLQPEAKSAPVKPRALNDVPDSANVDALSSALPTKVPTRIFSCPSPRFILAVFMWTCTLAGHYQLAPIWYALALAGLYQSIVCPEAFSSSTTYGVILSSYALSSRVSNLAFSWTFVGSLVLWISSIHIHKNERQHFRSKVHALQDLEKTNFRSVQQQLPQWIQFSDTERIQWINRMIDTMWPSIKVALTDTILYLLNPFLESIIEAQVSNYFRVLEFTHIELGSRGISSEGVRMVNSTDKGCIVMDVEVAYVADRDQIAQIKVESNVGVAIRLQLQELSIKGTLRISLGPFINEWPCFSAISICFLRKPQLDFVLTAAGMNLTNIPFASDRIHEFLKHTLLDYIIWPEQIHIPLDAPENYEYLTIFS